MIHLNVHTKLILPILFVIIMGVGSTSYIYVQDQIRSIDMYYKNILIRTSDMYQYIMSISLGEGDVYSAQNSLTHLKEDTYIHFVKMIDEEGELLIEVGNSKLSIDEFNTCPLNQVLKQNDEVFYIQQIHNNSEYLGILVIGINTTIQAAQIRSIIQNTILLNIFISILCFFIVRFIVSIVVHRPIQKFMKHISLIRSGQLIGNVEIKTKDEFYSLALSFNKMIRELKAMRDKLEENNAYLEETKLNLIREIIENFMNEKELIESKNQALIANEEKSSLLRRITHELRTPMNSILGFSKQLMKGVDNHDDAIKQARIIYENSQRLLGLINDILDFSKTKNDEYSLDDLVPLNSIQKLFETLEPLKKSPSVEFYYFKESHVADQVMTNKKLLFQVLTNLLGNSIKFTHEGTISVHVFHESDTHIYFKVTDTGVGIPKKYQDKIFEEFFQVSGEHQTEKGSGLGLNITQRFIQKLGGKIWLNPEYKDGAEFIFTIKKNKIDMPIHTESPEQISLEIKEKLTQLANIQFFRKSDILELLESLRDEKVIVETLLKFLNNHDTEQFYAYINSLIGNDE